MKRKYIMLFNYDTDEYGMEMIDAIKTIFPEAKIENYTVSRALGSPTIHYNEGESISIWLPEEQFLAVWTFVNMHISETEPEISLECMEDFLAERSINDGIDYMNEHLSLPEFYVNYCEVN